jgi:uncharacterized membrane protein YagU involved in acid resistance
MATKTSTQTALVADLADWKAGVIGGLGGGLVFGILMSMMMPDIIGGAIPGLYGFSGGVAGWTIHMAHSAVLGVVFAGVARAAPGYTNTLGKSFGAGIVYGIVLWAILGAIVMPIWVGAVLPMNPPVPNINPMSLVGHVVYGGLLGLLYSVFTSR